MGKCSTTNGLMGGPVTGKPVTECQNLSEVVDADLPAFGGAYLRRVYDALKHVIETRIPLVVTCAGPIGFRSAPCLAYPAHQGSEHSLPHGDRRDLLPRRTRLSA